MTVVETKPLELGPPANRMSLTPWEFDVALAPLLQLADRWND